MFTMLRRMSKSRAPKNDMLKNELANLEADIANRRQCIERNDFQGEHNADQRIIRSLQAAAYACPPHEVQAKQGFQNAATNYYHNPSRADRSAILLKIARGVLIKKTIALILLGAGGLTITALAPAGVATIGGVEYTGSVIDNGDGTHQLFYDTGGLPTADAQVTIENTTGAMVSPPEEVGVGDTINGVLETISGFF